MSRPRPDVSGVFMRLEEGNRPEEQTRGSWWEGFVMGFIAAAVIIFGAVFLF